MKKLSLVFGVLGILFMISGIYFLFNLSTENSVLALCSLSGGFLSTALFLITDKISCN